MKTNKATGYCPVCDEEQITIDGVNQEIAEQDCECAVEKSGVDLYDLYLRFAEEEYEAWQESKWEQARGQ